MTKTSKPPQLTRADVAKLMKENRAGDVEQARIEGRLDDMLGIERHWPPPTGQWSADDLTAMYKASRYDEIAAASAAGQLTLLGDTAGQPTEETA